MGTPEIRDFNIVENRCIARDTYELVLAGDTAGLEVPGRFVNIALAGCYLRRPLSVCQAEDQLLTLIYKVVGKGTGILSRMEAGARLDLLCPLGNGFDASAAGPGDRIVLVGGGAGLPPLYGLCKALLREGRKPWIVMGFGTRAEVFYEAEFRALGVPVAVTTLDGSYGVRGNVLHGAKTAGEGWDLVFACGPEPMLRAAADLAPRGQFSFESRMGCGFGACMGCSCKTLTGEKRICKEGPVFRKEEILWQTQA